MGTARRVRIDQGGKRTNQRLDLAEPHFLKVNKITHAKGLTDALRDRLHMKPAEDSPLVSGTFYCYEERGTFQWVQD